MKFPLFSRLYRIPVSLAVVVAGITFTYPNGMQGIVEDFRGYRQNSQSMIEAQEYDAQLNDRSHYLSDRIQAKQAIIQDVMHNRIQLLEAAERFLAMNMHDKNTMQFLQLTYHCSNDLERSARNIIDYVKYNQPTAKSTPVIQRLESQFRNHFGDSERHTQVSTHQAR